MRKVTQQKPPEYTTKTSSQVPIIFDDQSESSAVSSQPIRIRDSGKDWKEEGDKRGGQC